MALRTVEELLGDAEQTGSLSLVDRGLKMLPDLEDYDLSELTELDLSKNRLSTIPAVVVELTELEKLTCFHNMITVLPDFSELTSLTFVNLSRNQLVSIHPSLCTLPLKVLKLSTNHLKSLPAEIGLLSSLRELDLSNNELESLPEELEALVDLKDLVVCRNHLTSLPSGLGKMGLATLNVSDNQITELPLSMRHMKNLVTLMVDNNPLLMPPAQVCAKGRVHIFKFLSDEAKKLHNQKYNPHHDGTGIDLTFRPTSQSVDLRKSMMFSKFADNPDDVQARHNAQSMHVEKHPDDEPYSRGPRHDTISTIDSKALELIREEKRKRREEQTRRAQEEAQKSAEELVAKNNAEALHRRNREAEITQLEKHRHDEAELRRVQEELERVRNEAEATRRARDLEKQEHEQQLRLKDFEKLLAEEKAKEAERQRDLELRKEAELLQERRATEARELALKEAAERERKLKEEIERLRREKEEAVQLKSKEEERVRLESIRAQELQALLNKEKSEEERLKADYARKLEEEEAQIRKLAEEERQRREAEEAENKRLLEENERIRREEEELKKKLIEERQRNIEMQRILAEKKELEVRARAAELDLQKAQDARRAAEREREKMKLENARKERENAEKRLADERALQEERDALQKAARDRQKAQDILKREELIKAKEEELAQKALELQRLEEEKLMREQKEAQFREEEILRKTLARHQQPDTKLSQPTSRSAGLHVETISEASKRHLGSDQGPKGSADIDVDDEESISFAEKTKNEPSRLVISPSKDMIPPASTTSNAAQFRETERLRLIQMKEARKKQQEEELRAAEEERLARQEASKKKYQEQLEAMKAKEAERQRVESLSKQSSNENILKSKAFVQQLVAQQTQPSGTTVTAPLTKQGSNPSLSPETRRRNVQLITTNSDEMLIKQNDDPYQQALNAQRAKEAEFEGKKSAPSTNDQGTSKYAHTKQPNIRKEQPIGPKPSVLPPKPASTSMNSNPAQRDATRAKQPSPTPSSNISNTSNPASTNSNYSYSKDTTLSKFLAPGPLPIPKRAVTTTAPTLTLQNSPGTKRRDFALEGGTLEDQWRQRNQALAQQHESDKATLLGSSSKDDSLALQFMLIVEEMSKADFNRPIPITRLAAFHALGQAQVSSFTRENLIIVYRSFAASYFQFERMGEAIERKMKAPIPHYTDPSRLPTALSNGVVLCRLLNTIMPNAVSNIHTEEPLPVLLAMNNIESFLQGLMQLNIKTPLTATDIFHKNNSEALVRLLEELFDSDSKTSSV